MEEEKLEKLAIKEFINEYYEGNISDEELEELSSVISDNYNISSKEEVFSILRQAEQDEDPEEDLTKTAEEVAPVVEETKEEPVEEEPKSVEEKQPEAEAKPKKEKEPSKKNNKKKIIIISCIAGVVIIGLIVALLLSKKPEPKKTTKTVKTTWKSVLTSEAKDGKLKSKLIQNLDKLDIDTDDVNLMLMDIDSDETLELVVYAEGKSKKELLTYEIGKKVKFSHDYEITDINELSYVYNTINENFYWSITGEDSKKIVFALSDKTIDEEEYNNTYYLAANTYKSKNIIEHATEVDLSKDSKNISSSIKKVISKKFTNDEVLDDNNITNSSIKKKIEEEKEAEQKKQEEEEAKKQKEQEEAEAKKKAEEEKKKATAEVVSYNGNDIKLNVVINKMPQVDGNNLNSSAYAIVKFSSSFITNNIVTSVEYQYANNKYNNANVDNISNNELRINDIYVNDSKETSILVTFKNKDGQAKKYKVTAVGQVVE